MLRKTQCVFFLFCCFVSGRQSCVSLWWWHSRWGCAWEILLEEDQRACVPFRPPSSFMTRLQQGLPHSSSPFICLLWSYSPFTSHPLASYFWLFSKHARALCLSSICHMIALFIPITATFVSFCPRRPPTLLKLFAYSPLFPLWLPALRSSVGLSRVISKP